jgi:hypothetical protein
MLSSGSFHIIADTQQEAYTKDRTARLEDGYLPTKDKYPGATNLKSYNFV